ncbi:MAG: hypothetical protein JXQ87_06475 [Bacteroidia bacterium]
MYFTTYQQTMIIKPIRALTFFLAFVFINCAVHAQLIKMNSFSFGYYGHLSKLKPVSYIDFYDGFSLKNQLPNPTLLVSNNEFTALRIQGVSFEFEAQLLDKMEKGSRHFVGLGIRNGFIRSSQFNDFDKRNELFGLADKQSGVGNYSLKLKSEILGIGLSYKYALVDHERIQLFAGGVVNVDIPASTKMYAIPTSSSQIDTNDVRLINHDYFLTNDPEYFVSPFIQGSLKVWNATHINFKYHYGVYNLSINGLRTSGASRLFEIGLKFKV